MEPCRKRRDCSCVCIGESVRLAQFEHAVLLSERRDPGVGSIAEPGEAHYEGCSFREIDPIAGGVWLPFEVVAADLDLNRFRPLKRSDASHPQSSTLQRCFCVQRHDGIVAPWRVGGQAGMARCRWLLIPPVEDLLLVYSARHGGRMVRGLGDG